ncbi:DUF3592 domain-containing protein [Cohaesibacter sp. CAU 1516]|nr:DUF3592 domain-containing protein [Cohaesibacter sp. CAU 1516]
MAFDSHLLDRNMTQDTSPRRSSSLLVLLPLLAIMFGAFVYAGLGYIGYQEAQIPENWKTSKGQIVAVSVGSIETTKADGSKMEMFQPQVRYRYEVDGSFLIGTELSRHHPDRTLKGVAETEIEDLAQGSEVTVYYNPEAPAESVLRKSDTIGPLQAISAGLAIGLTTTAIFLITLLRRRVARQAKSA